MSMAYRSFSRCWLIWFILRLFIRYTEWVIVSKTFFNRVADVVFARLRPPILQIGDQVRLIDDEETAELFMDQHRLVDPIHLGKTGYLVNFKPLIGWKVDFEGNSHPRGM